VNPPPLRFQTARLTLRRPTIDDAQAIFDEYAADPEVTKYLVFTTHREVETVRVFLREVTAAAKEGTRFPWAITLTGYDRPIGMAEMRVEGARAEIGYVLAKKHWGQGYMPEALRVLVDWAMAQAEIHRVWAFCDVDNRGSTRVLEKIGMQREGILRKWSVSPNINDVPRDCYCYSVVKGLPHEQR
jgi:RimJ/RimL family protein N-acetyltransferase